MPPATALPAAPPPLLRQQGLLVGAFTALAIAALLLPLDGLHVPHQHYLPLHTTLEFVSVAASFLVFATVWHTPARQAPTAFLLIATALFAAGWLDFFHALSFKGMPALVTPASAEKGIAFWLAARLVMALTLCAVALLPRLPTPSRRLRRSVLAAYAGLSLLVIWAVLFHQAALPRTYIEGEGLTPLKRGIEWLITGLLALAAWRYHRQAQRSSEEFAPLMFSAAAIAALSEFFFTQYVVVSDVLNLLGHLYKFACYVLIYRAMFVVSVRRPYLELARQTATLQRANERLRTQSLALQSITAPVIVSDLQGQVRWHNRAAVLLTGQRPPAQPLSLFEPPITGAPAQALQMRAVLEEGLIWQGLVRAHDAHGQELVLHRHISPLRNDGDEVIGYVSVDEDITEQSRAESRHQRVLQTAIDGLWIVGEDGRLLEVNAAYARLSGYTAQELVGMHIAQLEASEDAEGVRRHMQQIMQTGSDRFETRHRHKQGHSYAVEISATYDPQSHAIYVFTRDRSEQERAEAVQLDLERQLQQSQKVQALGQLTSGIAHDFNNILAAILGYSSLALERFVPDKQGKLASYLREVITASERARDLIAKMLSFTRTRASSSPEIISPAAVLHEAVAMMRPSLPASIELRLRIDEEPSIRMDAGELNQVLVNLIINARDAIDEHGVIDLHLHMVEMLGQRCAISQQRLSGHYLALDVSDNGSGIASEHLPRLFDPFFTTKDVGKGTGLGLSVVHGILHRAGAHIVVDSDPGHGSHFRLLFPVVAAQAPAAEAPRPAELIPAGQGQQVWVVDDEAAVARYLAELLADWGYRARTFNDPAEALAALEAAPGEVDALITDQTMPGLSGLQLAQLARHFKPDLPVLLCTGFSDSLDEAQARRLGLRHFFTKPLANRDLLKALATELYARPAV